MRSGATAGLGTVTVIVSGLLKMLSAAYMRTDGVARESDLWVVVSPLRPMANSAENLIMRFWFECLSALWAHSQPGAVG
jgi:hypothetical protein